MSEYLPFIGSDRTKKVRKNLVDLIIPNGAGPQIFMRLFNSIMEHMTYTLENGLPGVRIIVVSQGPFGSHEILKTLQEKYPHIIFPVYKDKNIPPPVPYNEGLEYSARKMEHLSEFIMFLDDDMVILKRGMIEALKEHLEKYNFDLVATKHCFFGSESNLGLNGEATDMGMGSFFFKRKLFEKIGYLDERYGFHCSDTDYNRRIRLKDGKIAIVPNSDSFMHHMHQGGTMHALGGRHQIIINNDWKIFREKWQIENSKNTFKDINQPEENKISEIDITNIKHLNISNLDPLGRKKYLYDK